MKTVYSFILLLAINIIVSCGNKKGDVIEEFYPDGTIKSEVQVKDGLRNGLSKNYDERGRLTSTAEFVDDMYNGWMINYNPDNGKVTAKALYKNDNQHGPATLNYTDGSLYREMFYVDGRVDSIVKTYWPDGSLQAEVFFKKGSPAIGLKEFDKTGKPIVQPTLVIKQIDQLATQSKLILKVSLSEKTKDVEYFVGELIDGKYLDTKAVKLKTVNNETKLEYIIPRTHTLVKNVTIAARTRTEYGNTLLLFKNYFFSVKN